MFIKNFKNILTVIMLGMTLLFSDEFSDGPYGTGYFDIAGPFIVPDLSVAIQGDANLDEIINVQDIILLVGEILGNINLDDEEFSQADTNNDNIVDILEDKIVEEVPLLQFFLF